MYAHCTLIMTSVTKFEKHPQTHMAQTHIFVFWKPMYSSNFEFEFLVAMICMNTGYDQPKKLDSMANKTKYFDILEAYICVLLCACAASGHDDHLKLM